jgi:hypothetical protein
MHEIRTRIRVGADHTITGVAPPDVPPGEHEVTINVVPAPEPQPKKQKPFNVDDLPSADLGPWPEGLSLRREDLYDDDGR